MTHELENFLTVAWEAANAAGEIIRANWHKPITIEHKGAIDLVTSVDREAEQKIIEIISGSFANHSIIAEEKTSIETNQSEYRWIVDPLDGTTNFAHGYPQVSISIALEQNGRVIIGLVYDPLRRECFTAIRGHGASLDGTPIYTSQIKELDKALLATGFPYDRREHADFYLDFFKAFLTRSQGIRRGGSAALDLCYLACGRLDGFWELKLKPWDIAAGSLIVAEAGGKLSDFCAGAFSIRGNETLASNGLIHNEMSQITSEIVKRHAID